MDPPRATIQATGARGHGILSVSVRPADIASPSRVPGWPVPSPRPHAQGSCRPRGNAGHSDLGACGCTSDQGDLSDPQGRLPLKALPLPGTLSSRALLLADATLGAAQPSWSKKGVLLDPACGQHGGVPRLASLKAYRLASDREF